MFIEHIVLAYNIYKYHIDEIFYVTMSPGHNVIIEKGGVMSKSPLCHMSSYGLSV